MTEKQRTLSLQLSSEKCLSALRKYRETRWEFRTCPSCRTVFKCRKKLAKKHCSRACYDKSDECRIRCSIAGKISNKSEKHIAERESHWHVQSCPICHRNFRSRKVLRQKFCSNICAANNPAAKELHAKRLRENPIHLGHKHSKEAKIKMRLAKLGKRISIVTEFLKKGISWRHSQGAYVELHCLIRKLFGRPTVCEHCGKSNCKLDWASIGHVYSLERKDWLMLCKRCHGYFDNRLPIKAKERL